MALPVLALKGDEDEVTLPLKTLVCWIDVETSRVVVGIVDRDAYENAVIDPETGAHVLSMRSENTISLDPDHFATWLMGTNEWWESTKHEVGR